MIRFSARNPAFVVLLLGSILSVITAQAIATTAEERDFAHFRQAAQLTEDALTSRFETYETMLLGVRGLVSASQNFTGSKFRTYVDQLSRHRSFAGLQGIGFARWTPANQQSRLVREFEEKEHRLLRIWPEQSPHAERLVIQYLEPFDRRNAVALGYDMASEWTRREAILRARDTGTLAASGPVTLVQEIDKEKQLGFLLYSPIYANGLVPDAQNDRREQFIGTAYAPLRVRDFLQSLVTSDETRIVGFSISDRNNGAERTLFNSEPNLNAIVRAPKYSTTRELQFAGRTWVLRVFSLPRLEASMTGHLFYSVFGVGMLLSFLLFFLTHAQARGRARAEKREEKLRALAAHNDELLMRFTVASQQKDLEIEERKKAEKAIREEVETKQRLYEIGRTLNSDLDLRAIVEHLTEKATSLIDASFGIFLPHVAPDAPMTLPSALYGGAAQLKSAAVCFVFDIQNRIANEPDLRLQGSTSDSPYWLTTNIHKTPALGTLATEFQNLSFSFATTSLLLVSVRSRFGSPLGALCFGHASEGAFSEREAHLAMNIAMQAALALDNAHLLREAREAQFKAEEANRSKDDFLGVVSHELRTPLNAIHGWAQILSKREQRTDEKVSRGIDVIRRNAGIQIKLIEDILDIARILNGKLHLEMKPTSLRGLVQSAVESLRFAAEAKRITVTTNLPTPSVAIVDGARVQQVVWNLVSNAIKFTPEDGAVLVRLLESDQWVHLHVTDTGKGLRHEDLGVVFERFRQVDSSTTRAHGGLGLGLAIVRSIVEGHGGQVGAESEGLGRGATFWIEVPKASTSTNTPDPAGSPGGSGAAWTEESEALLELKPIQRLHGFRVLLVDDEVEATECLAEALRSRGAEVFAAASAPEALRRVGEIHPDILVSDIAMPGMDGYALLRTLRSLGTKEAHIPAIALTAFARSEDSRKALAVGFHRHIAKPLDVESLVLCMAELVGQRDASGACPTSLQGDDRENEGGVQPRSSAAGRRASP